LLAEASLSHTIPPFRLRNKAGIWDHREQCIGILPQERPYFLPLGWRVGHWKTELGSMPDPDVIEPPQGGVSSTRIISSDSRQSKNIINRQEYNTIY
jgi:hypothetical protein